MDLSTAFPVATRTAVDLGYLVLGGLRDEGMGSRAFPVLKLAVSRQYAIKRNGLGDRKLKVDLAAANKSKSPDMHGKGVNRRFTVTVDE